MEVFKFFLVFLIIQSTCCYDVKKLPIKADDFFELVKKLSTTEFFEFSETLKGAYEKREFKAFYSGTRKVRLSEVAKHLQGMIRVFMRQSVQHVGLVLVEYCYLAMWLVHKKIHSPADDRSLRYSDQRIREVLRFPDDCVFCVITAVHDGWLYADGLFDVTFFFRTFLDHGTMDQTELGDTETALSRHLENLIIDYVQPDKQRKFRSQLSRPGTPVDEIVLRLARVKEEISNFSGTFCSRWTPLVNVRGFLTKTVSQVVRNASRFVRYVLTDEKCRISVGEISIEEYVKRRIKNWIYLWNCDYILETQEYGLKQYEESVGPKKVASCAEFLSSILARIPNPSFRSEPTKNIRNAFSLAEIKEQLKSSDYYLNAVKYYHIVSDVMLMAAVKEGEKTIKGIKLSVRRSCGFKNKGDKDTATIETIRGLRPKLSAFKSVFDRFVDRIERDGRVDVNANRHKMAFGKRVSTLLPLLDVRDDVQRCCDEILKTLETANVQDRFYPADDPIGVTKFTGYYFDEPLLHVRQLHRFDAYDLYP